MKAALQYAALFTLAVIISYPVHRISQALDLSPWWMLAIAAAGGIVAKEGKRKAR